MPIPLVAFEEHYEAFFVWHHARDAGWLAESKNILLHVDEHADLRLPLSREQLPARHDAVAAAQAVEVGAVFIEVAVASADDGVPAGSGQRAGRRGAGPLARNSH